MRQAANTITEVTRRAIVDYLSIGASWSGTLPEDDFLGRLYDLKSMPSTDRRPEYNTAELDIWKHRVMNRDWPESWVFTDGRFDLMFGPDEKFLRFLTETIHPVVRPDVAECEAIAREYNAALVVDGWDIYPTKVISGKSMYGFREISAGSEPHVDEAANVAERLSGVHVGQQVRRLREALEKDTELAIGTAKEFVETICKAILKERKVETSKDVDFPALVKVAIRSLTVVPPALGETSQPAKTVTVLLGNLGSIGHRLAELRNQYGTGHGREAGYVGLQKRHAKLVVGAAVSLAVFLYECHEADKMP